MLVRNKILIHVGRNQLLSEEWLSIFFKHLVFKYNMISLHVLTCNAIIRDLLTLLIIQIANVNKPADDAVSFRTASE